MKKLVLIAAFVIAVTSTILRAQQSSPQLKLSTANGQIVFHIGERIPLVLSFTGPNDESYSINMANYDRSGRLGIDSFEVSPSTGWADPLATYFASGVFMAGGLFGEDTLSSKPINVTAKLNELIRFDEPGKYQLTVISHRIGHAGKTGSNFSADAVPLTSNTIQLEIIIAASEWQRITFDRALHDLRTVTAKPNDEQTPQRRDAIADLRYLATPDAIDSLAANIRDDRKDLTFDASFGLIGLSSSLTDTAVASMNRLVDDPDFPVSSEFIYTLVHVQMMTADLKGTLLSQEDYAARAARQQAYRDAAWHSVLASLPRKQGHARAFTAQTLSANKPADSSPDAEAQIASSLTAAFLQLPEDKQTEALLQNWDELNAPAMLPILQGIAKRPLSDAGSNVVSTVRARELKSAALHRWYSLDPEGANREILDQIGSAQPMLGASDLSYLPAQSLPQFENVWAKAFAQTDDDGTQNLLGSLLVRFGTGEAVPQMTVVLSQGVGKMACIPQALAIAYLVRFDSNAAKSFLAKATAANAKYDSGCSTSIFRSVSRYTHGPALTQAAIQSVDDVDPRVATDALEYLMLFGDASGKQPILERYLKWTQHWVGREAQLENAQSGEDYVQRSLGDALGRALLANQGWLADKALTTTVLNRCVGKQMCDELRQTADHPNFVTFFSYSGGERYGVAQYETNSAELFEAKIAQFPAGTNFLLTVVSANNDEERKRQADIEQLFSSHGMKLNHP